ncbi:MAG: CBS domain-containing protein [Rhizobiales bacterium]|nr:CBS domain-containing protein [Hyphomicrobiales bacterium]
MRAKDIMTTVVVSVPPDATIAEAVKTLLDHHISGLPVIDRSGQLAGILTEGDLMRRAELMADRRPWWLASASSTEQIAAAYVKAHGMKVQDVMTRDVVTIDEDEPLDRIAMLLEARGIKRVPVTKSGKLVGIVSRANLLRAMAASTSGNRAPSDDGIRSSIMRNVSTDAAVRAQLVDATVAGGVVHLWGNVASESEREAIRVVAENTEGVRGVKNHIRVLPPSLVDYKPE